MELIARARTGVSLGSADNPGEIVVLLYNDLSFTGLAELLERSGAGHLAGTQAFVSQDWLLDAAESADDRTWSSAMGSVLAGGVQGPAGQLLAHIRRVPRQ